MRRFHSYGPVDCEEHFCIPRQALVDRCVVQLVGNPEKGGHYFTIWAPRQTGKTWLMRQVKQEIARHFGDQFTVFNFSFGSLRGITYAPPPAGESLVLPDELRRAIVTAAVLTAATEEEAAWFVAPAQLTTLAIRTGRRIPLLPPESAAVHPDLAMARQMPSNRIVGAPDSVVAHLDALVSETTANEIMVFTFTHGIDERIRSLELLAQAWQ